MTLDIQQLLSDIDLLDFLEEQDIPFETTGKNIGVGWAGLEDCPFCTAPNYHFAVNISNKSIHCWVCGVDGTLIKLVMKLHGIPMDKALTILQRSAERSRFTQDMKLEDKVMKTFTFKPKAVENEKEEVPTITLPGIRVTSIVLSQRPKLRAYLKKRNISVQTCIKHKFRYDYERSLRLIMPVFDVTGNLVAYQGRDITDKALLPYITQPRNANLGAVLFNLNNNNHSVGLVVEGIIDAIRMEEMIGEGDICPVGCFTNNPSDDQLELIAKTNWKVLLVAFDYDSWTNYKKFVGLPMPVEPVILPRGKDPATLTPEEFGSLNLTNFV